MDGRKVRVRSNKMRNKIRCKKHCFGRPKGIQEAFLPKILRFIYEPYLVGR